MTLLFAEIDRKNFFDKIRPGFSGGLNQSQVDGMNALLDTWEGWAPAHADMTPNIRWLAYSMATTFHETGQTMQPVSEIGKGAGHDYGFRDLITHQIYYGRGYVQLTWKANYQVQGQRLNIDLEHMPDLALVPKTAADIMFTGMAGGMFTGRRLGQYFGANPRLDDPFNARRIINGLDCASVIAVYHTHFLTALLPPTPLLS